jgi:hypothetical protein
VKILIHRYPRHSLYKFEKSDIFYGIDNIIN